MSGATQRRGRSGVTTPTAAPSFWRARGADVWTTALALLLAAAAVVDLVLIRHSAWHVLDVGVSRPLFVLGMTGMFALCELALVHFEFRHEAYSISLAGIPMVLGVLTGSPGDLVLARVAGGLIGFAILRPPAVKALYNACAYAFDTATLATAIHWFLPVGARLDLTTAAICLLVAAAVDVLMSLLVVLVIMLHGSRLGLREIAQTLLPATIFNAASTTTALIAAVLVQSGTLGALLLAVTGVACAVMFKAYLVRRRRHQSLALIHDFVEQGAGLHSPEDLAARLLARMQTLLRCTEIELVLAYSDDPSAATTRLRTSDDGGLVVQDGPPVSADWLLLRVVATNEAVLLPRTTTDPGMRDWLAARGTRDALVVPMPGAGQELALIVSGRLGEATSFTKDDVTLTRTLFGHLAVALHGTRVVEQLRHDARHDSLTGLPNRALLGEALADALSRNRASCAVLLLDLDRFKEVNDALGHHVGDELLQVVARRLRDAVPPSSVVARLGGDEFAILLRASDNSLTEAQDVAGRIAAALSDPVQLSDALVSTGASIGIALPARGLTDSDMLRHADTAMYAAKAAGKPVLYSDELDRGRSERLVMLADLHIALERDELELLYQPQLDFETGDIIAAEALVRWRHPRLGVLSPDAFIPLAESTGLIHPLTDIVLRKALRQAKDWLDVGRDLTVAVNMSARTVDSSLPDKIALLLDEVGLPARNLVLEITESAVMDDPDRAVPTLRRVADLGVELSLDDFGTGYSSLSYLQRLPVQEVKIDRSFVFGLVGPSSSYTSAGLIRSIITIGEHLGLRVVAEGVENASVLEVLRSLGCDLAQGYHIGRPGTSEQLMALLDNRRAEATPTARPRPLRSVANQ